MSKRSGGEIQEQEVLVRDMGSFNSTNKVLLGDFLFNTRANVGWQNAHVHILVSWSSAQTKPEKIEYGLT